MSTVTAARPALAEKLAELAARLNPAVNHLAPPDRVALGGRMAAVGWTVADRYATSAPPVDGPAQLVMLRPTEVVAAPDAAWSPVELSRALHAFAGRRLDVAAAMARAETSQAFDAFYGARRLESLLMPWYGGDLSSMSGHVELLAWRDQLIPHTEVARQEAGLVVIRFGNAKQLLFIGAYPPTIITRRRTPREGVTALLLRILRRSR